MTLDFLLSFYSPPLCAGRMIIDMAELGVTDFNGLQFLLDMGMNPQEPLCILGTDDSNTIVGGNGDDVIIGGRGADQITGLRGKVRKPASERASE